MATENSSENTAQTSAASTPSPQPTAPPTSQATGTPQSSTTPQAGAVAGAVQAGAENAPVVQPQYTPNYKFKTFDKEYEIDEFFRPLIKDQDTEEKVRKLHTKAFGMEAIKEKLERQRTEHTTQMQGLEPKLRAYDMFNTIIENKDWDTFFKKLGVPDEDIFAYVEKKLALAQAPADQRAEYDRQIALRQQSYQQNFQLQEMQSAYQQQAVQTRTMQLDFALNRPDVQKYATSWDERMGNIGAFRQLVVDEAAANYYQTGQDLSAEEAINLVIQKFGKVIAPSPTQGGQIGVPAQASQPGQVPIIPHVAGRGTSPVKKVPKSLDDLKKLANELA